MSVDYDVELSPAKDYRISMAKPAWPAVEEHYMKRRDFLKNSAGAAASFLPLSALAQGKPCPPSPLSVKGGSSVQTKCISSADAEADWLLRSRGDGVVFAHDFRYPEELTNFQKLGVDYTYAYPDVLIGRRAPNGITGGYCLQYTNIGTSTAKPIDTATTKIELTDASDFPDPENGKFPYRVVLQIDKLTNKSGTGRENVTVTAKQGNVLTVIRATHRSTVAVAWPAGTTIGWDCEGQWVRPLSALPKGFNGLPVDDPAAGGTLPLRNYRFRAGEDAGRAVWNFQEGYWGHRDYHQKYPTWMGNAQPWNGDEFYLQFRVKIDGRRWDPVNVGNGKLFFLHTGAGGATQLVGTMEAKNKLAVATAPFGMFTNYGSGPSYMSHLTNPQGGRQGSELQPGSSFAGCRRGETPERCWEWPADEWVTVLLHIKPGHHNPVHYGLVPGAPVPQGAVKVDTSVFKPINDGASIQFETNAVPEADEYRFNGSLDNQAAGFFNNWYASFPSGTLAAATKTVSLEVASYTVINGRARWRLVPTKESNPLPDGVPASGDVFGVEWGSLLESAKYKDTTINAWVARAGETEYTQLFKKSD
ncbi:MAG: hypothetical protein EHM77_03810, partial [Planctomycetaceae bacterium]